MRNLTKIILTLLCLFYSCKQSAPNSVAVKPVDTAKATAKVPDTIKAVKTDTVKKVITKSSTINVDDLYAKSRISCPISVRKCSIASLGHGSKAVIVTLYNNTSKKISAVKIWWIVYNKAGKQIGNSSGMAKKEVARGKTASYSWDINAPSGTKAKAFIYSVRYKDGSSWKVQ